MKNKHKKKEKTECDSNYIEDYSNCSVDEDFDEIEIDSLIDKNILKDWKDAG